MLKFLDVLLMTAGLGIAGYGAYLTWPPLAFLSVGVALIWAGLPD